MSYHLSPSEQRRLIEAAFRGKEHAYSPYSKFPVGSAVLCLKSSEDATHTMTNSPSGEGEIFMGGSIDNACWAETICAERVAIFKAVSQGYLIFRGLSIVSNAKSYITPCGLCRQVMAEFCSPDMPILLVPGDLDDSVGPTVKAFRDLLPQ